MKKILALLLSLMLVLSLAACGGSDDATEADATATEETTCLFFTGLIYFS